MRYFNYGKIAKKAGIPSDKLEALCKMVRQEFPHDDMMYELHLLRACRAIQQRHTTIDDALHFERAA